MGGNASISGCPAPEPIKAEDRWVAHKSIEILYEMVTGELLKPQMLSGSTAILFDRDVETEDLKQIKPLFGDIDLIADVDNKAQVVDRLYELEDQDANRETCEYFLVRGVKAHGSEVTAVITLTDLDNQPIQVDFEFKEFDGYYPTKFAQFSQSAPLEDLKQGIPGVYHKQLVMALTYADAMWADVLYKRRGNVTEIIREIVPRYTFSVAKGMRKTWESVDGGGVRRLKPSETEYLTDVPIIARTLLKITDPFIRNPEQHLQSFSSIVRYLNQHWQEDYIEAVADDFYSRVMGEKNRINRTEEEKRWVMSKLCQELTTLTREPFEPQYVQEDSLVPL